jgi:hypothetical protein
MTGDEEPQGDDPAAASSFTWASRIPLQPESDTPRVLTIKRGLNAYFAAVSLRHVSRAAKLAAIAQTFSPTAQLITPSGDVLHGAHVISFYDSDASPVLKDANFSPRVNLDTLCISADGHTLAVEIRLTDTISVGDWFSFDAEGKISRMRIYG